MYYLSVCEFLWDQLFKIELNKLLFVKCWFLESKIILNKFSSWVSILFKEILQNAQFCGIIISLLMLKLASSLLSFICDCVSAASAKALSECNVVTIHVQTAPLKWHRTIVNIWSLAKVLQNWQQGKISFHSNSKSSDMARARVGTVLGTMEVIGLCKHTLVDHCYP